MEKAIAIITARGGSKKNSGKKHQEFLRQTDYRILDRGGVKEWTFFGSNGVYGQSENCTDCAGVWGKCTVYAQREDIG